MNKLKILTIIALSALLVISSPVLAQVIFTIEAELPASDQANFTVSQVFVTDDGQGGQDLDFQPFPSQNLDFGLLALNGDGIFAPSPTPFFFVIDIGSNGAGNPDVTFVYTDTANPNGGLNNGSGLGNRATINFAEIVTNPDLSQTTNDIATVALADIPTVNGGVIDETDFALGFLRVSVGLANDNTIANAAPFTSLDAPDVYTGELTATAVFD